MQQQEGDKEKELCSYLKAYGVCRLGHLKLFIRFHFMNESQEFVQLKIHYSRVQFVSCFLVMQNLSNDENQYMRQWARL